MGERMCHQTGWGRTHHVTVAVQRSGSASGSAASRRDIMGLWSSFPREQNTVEAGHSTASETWGTASRPVPALTRLTSLPYLAVASPPSSLPAPSPPSPPSAASSSSAACSIHPPHRAAPRRTATHRNAPATKAQARCNQLRPITSTHHSSVPTSAVPPVCIAQTCGVRDLAATYLPPDHQ